MKNKELIRIGSDNFVNESELENFHGFNLLFDGIYEFVHIPDDISWNLVNGTWQGAFGRLMDDTYYELEAGPGKKR